MKRPVSIIVAVAKNNVIGLNGTMPWHCKPDLQYFKKRTMDCPVIMGRTTWESLPMPLHGRHCIVLSKTKTNFSGALHAKNLDEAISKSNEIQNGDEIYIAGGSNVYEQSMNIADNIYFTEIDITTSGDSYFPPIDKSNWIEKKEAKTAIKSDGNNPACRFLHFIRNK